MAAGKSEGDEKEGKPSGFTVSDRRIFSEASPSPEGEAPHQRASTDPAALADAPTPLSPPGHELSVVDFHTFILSLGSSALLHLGELEHPDGGPAHPDLPLAKHTIDIIAMLQDKTKGNLSPPEERLIESLLYDLRLRFVELSKAPPPP
jgi:Domain of unknown function (DUF1844)